MCAPETKAVYSMPSLTARFRKAHYISVIKTRNTYSVQERRGTKKKRRKFGYEKIVIIQKK
jgi:hypothetical protein